MAQEDVNNSPSFSLISLEASAGNQSTNQKTTCPCTEYWIFFLINLFVTCCSMMCYEVFFNLMHKAIKAGCTHLNMSTHWNEGHSVADFHSLLIVCLSLTKSFLREVAREHTQSMTRVRQSTMHVLGPCCVSLWTLSWLAAQIPQQLDSLQPLINTLFLLCLYAM